ncbi:MAG: hypothetical protein RL272_381 [Candidatus Parcubacteria bacterium]|jgi:hypothetical protein
MHRRHDEHKRHLALWIAVGGTMSVIVVLWVLILPMQLQGQRFNGMRDAARWNAARGDGAAEAPTLAEVLAKQRRQLEAIEKGQQAKTTGAAAKIDELRAKIEAASQKNEAPPATNQTTTP